MEQKKIAQIKPGQDRFIVRFTALENTYFSGMDNILKHNAVVVSEDYGLFNCIMIDGKPAETRRPARTIKTAVKYAYFVK